MKPRRKAEIQDMVRRYAQGVVENLELIWQADMSEFTDEEFIIAHKEQEAIAKRIGRTRTFVSKLNV